MTINFVPHPFRQALWWFRINRAVGRSDHASVVALAEARLLRNGDDLAALHLAAIHAAALGREGAALAHARRALALDPDDFDLHALRLNLLDPDQDKDELEETARWLVALSDTTQPGRDRESERLLERLFSFPLPTRLVEDARREIASDREFKAEVLDWARAYLKGKVG